MWRSSLLSSTSLRTCGSEVACDRLCFRWVRSLCRSSSDFGSFSASPNNGRSSLSMRAMNKSTSSFFFFSLPVSFSVCLEGAENRGSPKSCGVLGTDFVSSSFEEAFLLKEFHRWLSVVVLTFFRCGSPLLSSSFSFSFSFASSFSYGFHLLFAFIDTADFASSAFFVLADCTSWICAFLFLFCSSPSSSSSSSLAFPPSFLSSFFLMPSFCGFVWFFFELILDLFSCGTDWWIEAKIWMS